MCLFTQHQKPKACNNQFVADVHSPKYPGLWVVLQLKWAHLMNHSRGVHAFYVHELAMFNASCTQVLKLLTEDCKIPIWVASYYFLFILLRIWIAWYPLAQCCCELCCICNVFTLTHTAGAISPSCAEAGGTCSYCSVCQPLDIL